ncbi:MAG: type I glyceraldehyde-3-phosphate dehydrogenase [Candidatus Wildermuthbacteria bacterium RIFCSPHIGHO2_02_FULL_48_16]|uniref:Type I glyceraldehyde-3-phosphate dehydrogenase n=2 Tax=Candidatus Wildermuthiibacteriota TaxID=1817923 RepID=A0A1G2RAB0_9BACT|nr:MAG: type I glyceraldehyde-3-phosphate dehydrogenase [Candidatus Wildermuthbacteria bacterium RIFCSPHIGHO2_01_FULL_48_25]OHA69212.1 MAG: type I glyceraldehyde-3-phosphate dehydrogenase [Candidatus Wildermuthbacteria bacterium RIFCSPHIGHO2_02_FULL_48_16]OHA73898.1 MAG: type I glyceraldehyde-3-phosphate dehydrogenase [Candidatus Wildermuthbacteria bacterium RIFCSPLOWO2_01_FULL_48_16]
MTKIGINGFGRIGRLLFRQLLEKNNIQIVAVNDLGDMENLAYLLQYDTVYGRLEADVKVKGRSLLVAGHEVQVLQEKDPAKLPWRMLGVDVVVESTGVFESYEKARVHVEAGAKRVIITAPAKDEDSEEGKTVLMGVNEDALSTCVISSNGSCTTNSASSVVEVLREKLGIKKAVLSTVHGYTATQNLVDGATRGKDFRRGRAAGQNIVPSSTGAAIAVARAVKELEGKFDGIAFRVPVVAGSVADITFVASRPTSVEEVNTILSEAAQLPRWKGILKVTEEPLVSSDILKEPYGAIVDLNFTRVIDGDLVKVLSWYDNEWGYVATLVKHLEAVARSL